MGTIHGLLFKKKIKRPPGIGASHRVLTDSLTHALLFFFFQKLIGHSSISKFISQPYEIIYGHTPKNIFVDNPPI